MREMAIRRRVVLLAGSLAALASFMSCSTASVPPAPSGPPRAADPVAVDPEVAANGPPVSEGRLMIEAGSICAALRTGVYCRGLYTRDDPQGRPQRLSKEPDIVGLVASPDIVCGRKRRGPASCWRLGDTRAAPWMLASPAIATSIAVSRSGEVCATGEGGDLWCGKFGGDVRRVETAERVSGVAADDDDQMCVLTRSNMALCRANADAEWRADGKATVLFSATIGCSYVAPGRRSCAWRDDRDKEAIEIAGYDVGRQFPGAIEIEDGVTYISVLLADGRLDFRTGTWDELFVEATARHHPKDVVELEYEHQACVLDASDRVYCQGSNLAGQLGRGSPPRVASPTRLEDHAGVQRILAFGETTCLLAQTGGWACADSGSFLDEPGDPKGVPDALSRAVVHEPCTLTAGHVECRRFPGGPIDRLLSGARSVVGNSTLGCAERRDGKVSCWSKPDRGHVVEPTSLRGPLRFVGSNSRACVVDRDAALWCWGSNGCGELGIGARGDGKLPDRCDQILWLAGPTRVPGVSDVAAVAVGSSHTCVSTKTGHVECQGNNRAGQLGLGTIDAGRSTFARVPKLDDVIDLAAGFSHTCALRRDRSVWCWGDNESGAFGAGRHPFVEWWSRWPTGAAEPDFGTPPDLMWGVSREVGGPDMKGERKADGKPQTPPKRDADVKRETKEVERKQEVKRE